MKISLWVIFVHIALLVVAFMTPHHRASPKEKLVVKTLTLQPKVVPPQPKAAPTPPVAAAKPKPAPSAPPTSKKTEKPKSTAVKKETPPVKKRPSRPQESAPTIPSHLLRELEETIAKIDEKREKVAPQKKANPAPKMAPLQSEKAYAIEMMQGDAQYRDILIIHLKQSLQLPDFGDVKVQITLNNQGEVLHVKVLAAESVKNRTYLERQLPLLKFPPLNGSSEKRESTFILTFGNSI